MRLAKVFIGGAFIQSLGLVLTLALGVQLARYLGPVNYGIYGVILGALSLLLVPSQLGMPVLAIREVPLAVQEGRVSLGSLWRWHMVRPLLASLAIFLFAWLMVPLLATTRGLTSSILFSAALLGVLLTLLPVAVGLLRGLGHNMVGQLIELVAKPGLTAVILAALYLSTANLTLEQALLSQLLVTALCLVWAGIAFFCVLPKNRGGVAPYRPLAWISAAAALSGNLLFSALNGNYPILVASLFTLPHELGALRVALASFAIVGLPSAIANITSGPLISKELAAGRRAQLHDLLSFTTLAGFAATLVGMIIFLLCGQFLITLVFGEEYRGAYGPLLVLGTSQLIVTAFGVAGIFLALCGRERLVLQAYAVAVPAGVITSLLLTPVFGIMGAASGTITMAAVWHFYVFVIRSEAVGDAPLSLIQATRHLLTRAT